MWEWLLSVEVSILAVVVTGTVGTLDNGPPCSLLLLSLGLGTSVLHRLV